MKKTTLQLVSLLIVFGFACAAGAATVKMLTPLSSFGAYGDGSVRPGDPYPPYPPITVGTGSTGYQRGYAYDPTTGNTVLVDPNVGSNGGTNFLGGIYVIDGNNGQVVSTLATNGIVGGTYSGSAAAVAADGVVYMCNQINNNSFTFRIYSWTNVWQSNAAPYLAFSNTIPLPQRYGATMDVRGSGPNTQIIIGSKAYGGTSGTNVVIFTTTNGIDFTATPLSTDATTADFAEGVVFGAGNTFWAKSVYASHPLRLMSFNLATASATTVASFDTATSLPGAVNVGAIAVDPVNNLLAGIEEVSVTVAPQRVWFYDISATLANPAAPPSLLDIKSFSAQNPFATAPNGFLDFGGGNLYTHAINNGLLTFTVDTVTMPAPTIYTQPGPATSRKLPGQSITYQVTAYPACTYQWRKNGLGIPNATNAYYSIPSLAVSDSGTYSVLVANAAGSVPSSSAVLTVVNPASLYHLNGLWSVGPAAGAPYMNSSGGSSTPNQRTIAYNALSNELYIVSRSGANYNVYAIAATNVSATPPAVLKSLNTNGISGGSLTLVAIGCADDGAIYACNVDNTGNWKLYRWANSDTNTAPVCVWGPGEPSKQGTHFRFGDVMHVRGSGLNTQIIIDNQDVSGSGKAPYVVAFTPSDQYMTNFNATVNLPATTYPNTIIGRSLQWVSSTDLGNNTFWQKHYGTKLIQSTFDFSYDSAIAVSNISYSTLPSTMGPVWVDPNHNLLVGVKTNNTTAPHSVEMYDVTDPTSPIFISSYAFPASPPQGNANFIAQCLVAGDYVFAISGNNGLMGYQLVSGPPTAPGFLAQPQDLQLLLYSSGALSVTPDQSAAFQWRRNGTNLIGATASSYAFNSAQLSDAGSYTCVLTNTYGASTSSVAVVTVVLPADTYSLSPLWSVAPGARPYASNDGATTPYERSIAYNALSNQLLVVKCPPSSTAFAVYVVDANTGASWYTLNTNAIVHQSASEVSGANPIDLLSAAVADDGAVYICNASPNASGGSLADPTKMFQVYRWADSGPATAPVSVFMGDPAGQTSNRRWGDAMAVRGSGLNTQLILDDNRAEFGALLVPSGSIATFTNQWYTETNGTGSIGRSLQFGPANTFFEKRQNLPLKRCQYDLTAQTMTPLAAYNAFPSTLGGLALDLARNLAAGVDFTGGATAPDTLALFDITDLNAPKLIARYNFPINQQANANYISQTVFAGDKLFALDGNNGIVGFNIVAPAGPQLGVTLSGAQVLLSWPGSTSGFTLYSAPAATGPFTTAEGPGTLNNGQYWVTNNLSGTAKFYRLQK